MENFVGFVIFVTLVAVVAQSGSDSEEPRTEREKAVIAAIHGQRYVRQVRPSSAPAKTAAPKPSRRGQTVRMTSSDSSEQAIRQAAQAFDVPAGQLFGHWTAESGRLDAPYGKGGGWLTVAQLGRGGACAARYPKARKRCAETHRILHAICAQRKPDGSRVCDTTTVRLSVAYAMGPLQIMPNTLAFEREDGSIGWTSVAVDGDGDGVIDPFSRADAFASAAKLVRIGFDRHGHHLGSIDRYYGAPKAKYRQRVIAGWREWCSRHGCQEERTMVASN